MPVTYLRHYITYGMRRETALGNTFGSYVGGQFEPISSGTSGFRQRTLQAQVLP